MPALSRNQSAKQFQVPEGDYVLELVEVGPEAENKYDLDKPVDKRVPRRRLRFVIADYQAFPEDMPYPDDYVTKEYQDGEQNPAYQAAVAWARREAEYQIGKDFVQWVPMNLGQGSDLSRFYEAIIRRRLDGDDLPFLKQIGDDVVEDISTYLGRRIRCTIKEERPRSGGEPRPKIQAGARADRGPKGAGGPKQPKLGEDPEDADGVDAVPF